MFVSVPRKVMRVSSPLPVPVMKLRLLVLASFSVPPVDASVTSIVAAPASTSVILTRLPLAVDSDQRVAFGDRWHWPGSRWSARR